MREDHEFKGDNEALVRSAQALLYLDENGALFPIDGIGGHARIIIKAFIARMNAAPTDQGARTNTDPVLSQALRQYRHNNSDEFVFGYDIETIDGALEVVAARIAELEAALKMYVDLGISETNWPELDQALSVTKKALSATGDKS